MGNKLAKPKTFTLDVTDGRHWNESLVLEIKPHTDIEDAFNMLCNSVTANYGVHVEESSDIIVRVISDSYTRKKVYRTNTPSVTYKGKIQDTLRTISLMER
jgi:hypothetical protein